MRECLPPRWVRNIVKEFYSFAPLNLTTIGRIPKSCGRKKSTRWLRVDCIGLRVRRGVPRSEFVVVRRV